MDERSTLRELIKAYAEAYGRAISAARTGRRDEQSGQDCDHLWEEIDRLLPPGRNELDAVPELADDMHLTVVDIAKHGRRLYGDAWPKVLPPGTPLREHDYRFEMAYAGTGRISFNEDATAEYIARYMQDIIAERARQARRAARTADETATEVTDG